NRSSWLTGLIYYRNDEPAAFRFRLAGDLCGHCATDLDCARETASMILRRASLIVDLTGIRTIDSAGRELLEKWRGLGARFVVTPRRSRALIEAMSGLAVGVLQSEKLEGTRIVCSCRW